MNDDVDKIRDAVLRGLRKANATLEAAREKREARIREAHAAGVSLRDIADEVGVSHETVRRIIDG